MMKLLKVERIDVFHGYIHAIRELSLEINSGEILAIIGANGAGKSTLLETLVGLHKPARGNIIYRGVSIVGKSPEDIVRQGISLVPERREIFHSLTVLDNLLLGAFHRYPKNKDLIARDLARILELFPALKGRKKDPAGSLSGGLQQMLTIGRALMSAPRLLLLDEPSVGLAPLAVREIMSVLADLKETGVTMVLVEQNTKCALKTADRALVMERGKVILDGHSQDVLSDARVCAAYLGTTRN